jgi:pyridoxamine 5'-phosphate oxidase
MSDTAPIEHPSWLTGGDFTAADEPLRLFAAWLGEATAAEPRDPTAMTLATVDAGGLPNARMVLLKGVAERGFVFYTNVDSQKGQELDSHPQAALVFHWKSLNRQVRVRGTVERVTEAEADDYFATRPKQAQIGASRKPARLRKSGRALRRQIRARHGAAAAELVGLPHRTAAHRILARPAVPAARPHRIRARKSGRAVEQDATLSVR